MYYNQQRFNKLERLRRRVRVIQAQLERNRIRVNYINRQVGYLNRNIDNKKLSLLARHRFAGYANRLLVERRSLISESRSLLAELRRISATKL